MKRRSLLELVATAAVAGGAGCTRFIPSRRRYRLWFVRIHNGTTTKQRVDIRVLRDGEVIFEQQYENIPSFQDDQNEEASFSAMESARLIESEWEIQKDTYSIEYRLSERDPFETVEVDEMGEFDADDVGVDMQLLGDEQARVGFKLLEFDSEAQATQFVSTVTNQSDG